MAAGEDMQYPARTAPLCAIPRTVTHKVAAARRRLAGRPRPTFGWLGLPLCALRLHVYIAGTVDQCGRHAIWTGRKVPRVVTVQRDRSEDAIAWQANPWTNVTHIHIGRCTERIKHALKHARQDFTASTQARARKACTSRRAGSARQAFRPVCGKTTPPRSPVPLKTNLLSLSST